MSIDSESRYVLTGGQLAWARAGWIVIAGTMFGAVLASWPPYIRLLMAVCETCEITPAYAETLQASGVSTAQWAIFIIVPSIVVYLGWMGMGAAIFLLKSNDRRAVLLSALLIVIGASFGGTIGFIHGYLPEWVWVSDIINTVSFPAMVGLIYLFPNGEFEPPWLAWLLCVQTLLFLPIPFDNLNFPIAYNFVITFSFVLSCVAVPVYRYRRVMTFTERQQTKWVVFGIVLAMAGIATTTMLVVTGPAPCDERNLYCDMVQNIGYTLSPLMIPIFIGIGILRSRLWDIDVVIRRTLQYSLITGLLALTYFGIIIVLQSLFSSISNQQSDIAIVISTLAIAALFNPLRRRVQDFIDRRFYRKKYNAEQALAKFAAIARDEVELEKLTAALLGVIEETVQPEKVSLWLKPTPKKGMKRDA